MCSFWRHLKTNDTGSATNSLYQPFNPTHNLARDVCAHEFGVSRIRGKVNIPFHSLAPKSITRMAILLLINGKSVTFNDDPQMPLLWVIRDFAGFTGTKYGCGIAQCGACTIHVDGKMVRSCSLPVSAAANKSITTIEGLSPDGTHPLQRAWEDEDVPQCGYCQAGQIMAAAAFLKDNPEPSDDAITQAMKGNICRCGTYTRIHSAIKRAVEINKQASR